MPAKTRTRPEAGDRTVDWTQLIETALTAPGSVGDVHNRFYTYSFMNQMLLRMQGVTEPVATYNRWQTLGRQVVKGAKAKTIIRPITIEKKDDAGEVTDKKLLFKPVRCLFGVSDTTGEPLPDVQMPGWDLDTALERLNIRRVPFQDLDGNTQGYSIGHDVAINPVAVHAAHTMMHEIGHVVLGHTDTAGLQEYQAHRGRMEFQAEATAYLTMNELDQLTPELASHSRGYVQGWLRGEQPGDLAIRQGFAATDQILKAGRAAER